MDQKLRQRLKEISQYRHALSPLAHSRRTVKAGQGDSDVGIVTIDPALKSPLFSQDAPLNALAQLAALRLNCERCFISIIDDKTQHIIAEATRSISVFDQNVHRPNDGLCLGLRSLPSKSGACPSSIKIFTDDVDVVLGGTGSRADASCIIINNVNDISSDHDFPLLAALPKTFEHYVEVPLKTDSGCVLGSVCVVDPVFRDHAPADVARLQEVAKLVLRHLESVTLRDDQRRAERLLQGLAHFVRGRSSLSSWSQSAPDQQLIPSIVQESTNLSTANVQSDRSTFEPSQKSHVVKADGEADSTTSKTPTVTSVGENLTTLKAASTPASSKNDGAESKTSRNSSAQVEIGFDPLPESKLTDDLHPATMASVNIRRAFSRASNLIRESLDLDATSFLEVPQNERYKNMNSSRARDQTSVEKECSTTEESEESTDSSGEVLPETLAQTASPDSPSPTPADTSLCHRLGYSTRLKSSLANSSATKRFMTIPARLLNRLAAKYPEGHIFHFDIAGGLSSSDEDKRPLRRQRAGARGSKKIADDLFDLFPAARSLIFLPLYDNSRQHVYAGFLGWTADVARYLRKHEIVYVSGFANSVMCEVMRLEAIATDKAKSDFISSISHELRSPLHGILAAGQLLWESRMDREQTGYVQMVSNCAHTLLDIMNHLLDHAKINQFRERQGHERGLRPLLKHAGRAKSETYSLVSSMNLVSVVEETAASMAITRRSSPHLEMTMSPIESPLNATLGFTTRNQPVPIPIILSIQPHQDWSVDSEPGSWRRIIMNLIGNSLNIRKQEGENQCTIELKIKDTGQGISEDYLKHRLYTPFAQEDNLSVGAGLGLSLVKQIVSSLHGKISIQSEVGTGTEITVQIPVERSNSPLPTIPDSEMLMVTDKKAITFFGFDSRPPIFENPTGIMDPHAAALLSLKGSIADFSQDWFGMQLTSVNPDIYVIEENFLNVNIHRFDQQGNRLLVVGADGRSSTANQLRHADHVYVLPPIGPKQLGNAFSHLLNTAQIASGTSPAVQLGDPSSTLLSKSLSMTQSRMSQPGASSNSPSASQAPSTSEDLTGKDDLKEASPVLRRPSDGTQPMPADPNTAAGSNIQKRLVMLVDDNEINLRLLIACATRIDHVEHITAMNGKEAFEKYQSTVESGSTIDAIFMDISMPIMNGFESTRNIRAYEEAKGLSQVARTKIIALTGLASAEAQQQVDESGFDVYLRKPVNVKILREMLSG